MLHEEYLELQRSLDSHIHPYHNKFVIVRCAAGVFAGTLKNCYNNRVILENSRRLYRWHTANNGLTLSEVGVFGINPANSKICVSEPTKELWGISEITPCSLESRQTIERAVAYVVR